MPASNATVAVGSGSGSIAGGDIDGDLDILTTGAINNTVSVRLNGAGHPCRTAAGGAGRFLP